MTATVNRSTPDLPNHDIAAGPDHHPWPWADIIFGIMLFNGIDILQHLPMPPLVQIVLSSVVVSVY